MQPLIIDGQSHGNIPLLRSCVTRFAASALRSANQGSTELHHTTLLNIAHTDFLLLVRHVMAGSSRNFSASPKIPPSWPFLPADRQSQSWVFRNLKHLRDRYAVAGVGLENTMF